MNITYEIYSEGYTITTSLGNVIVQEGKNNKPIDKTKTIEENCKLQIDEMYISDYSEQLYKNQINEKDIPTEYLDKVKSICNERLKKDSTYNEKQYDAVIASLITEGVL